MAGAEEVDSFQQYKTYLQSSVTEQDITRPPRVMKSFQIFCFQRKAQERGKTNKKISYKSLKRKFRGQWRKLPQKKKILFEKLYQIRKTDYDNLKLEYQTILGNRKNPNAYICYYRKKYPLLSLIYKELDQHSITKIIAQNWKNINEEDRKYYEQQAIEQQYRHNRLRQTNIDILKYEQKVKHFKKLINQDKQKILKKYRICSRYLYKQKTSKTGNKIISLKKLSPKNKKAQEKITNKNKTKKISKINKLVMGRSQKAKMQPNTKFIQLKT